MQLTTTKRMIIYYGAIKTVGNALRRIKKLVTNMHYFFNSNYYDTIFTLRS